MTVYCIYFSFFNNLQLSLWDDIESALKAI